jgi:hypothetical protein
MRLLTTLVLAGGLLFAGGCTHDEKGTADSGGSASAATYTCSCGKEKNVDAGAPAPS